MALPIGFDQNSLHVKTEKLVHLAPKHIKVTFFIQRDTLLFEYNPFSKKKPCRTWHLFISAMVENLWDFLLYKYIYAPKAKLTIVCHNHRINCLHWDEQGNIVGQKSIRPWSVSLGWEIQSPRLFIRGGLRKLLQTGCVGEIFPCSQPHFVQSCIDWNNLTHRSSQRASWCNYVWVIFWRPRTHMERLCMPPFWRFK